jgi:hypothetical protein
MDSAKLNDWMQVLGMFAIVASLIFVGLQMKQSRDISLGEGAIANAANKIDVTNAFSAHAEVWAKGRSGGELDEVERIIFQNLIENRGDQLFFNWQRVSRLGYDDAADAIIMNMSLFLIENPGARQVWIDQEIAYKGAQNMDRNREVNFGWFDAVQSGLKKLEDGTK